ncbi:hypothetical protein ACVCNR_16550 [Aquamicrobium terrae]
MSRPSKHMMRGLMRLRIVLFGVCSLAVGCAAPETKVLDPYQLADGSRYQDVVTIGADKSGASPVVTDIKTFRLGNGKNRDSRLVSQATGSSPGMTAVVGGAIANGTATGITAGLISYASRSKTTVNVDGKKSLADVQCSELSEAERLQIQKCICEISSFNPGCENAGGSSNPPPFGG